MEPIDGLRTETSPIDAPARSPIPSTATHHARAPPTRAPRSTHLTELAKANALLRSLRIHTVCVWRRYTPLRLASLLRKGALTLASLEYLVLDEADKLLELGFLAVRRGARRVRWRDGAALPLLSATMPPAVEDLVHSVLRQLVKVVVGEKNAASDTVD